MRWSILLLLSACAFAQWQPLASATKESLRGLSVYDQRIVWAGGTRGAYLVTTDGGMTWRVRTMPGAEALDFRAVKSFGAEAYLMAAGEGEKSRIYHTSFMGEHWELQYTNLEAKGFFDCMAFFDRRHGIVVGDPVKGKFQILRTNDAGVTWRYGDPRNMPPAVEGEGAFAASNTCLTVQGGRNVWFVTGGAAARIFHSSDGGKRWAVTDAPKEMPHGEPSAGIFSVAFYDDRHGVIAGGDYKHPENGGANLATTADGGKTWQMATLSPQQYVSGVSYLREGDCLVAVGPSASTFSADGLKTWQWVSGSGFNAVAATGNVAYAVGANGVIAKADLDSPCERPSNGR
jgi:photosystem II stability/assembly factor-like uncharacterized protein